MKRQIEKILNKFFKSYEYDLTVGERGKKYYLSIEADQRGRGDWRYELARNYVDATKDPDGSPFNNQDWVLRNIA